MDLNVGVFKIRNKNKGKKCTVEIWDGIVLAV